jgi:TP901 family phage tail tape measure protein
MSDLKTVLGFEASQAISTLAKLNTQLAGYTTSIMASASATGTFNTVAMSTDAAIKKQAAAINNANKEYTKNTQTIKGAKNSLVNYGVIAQKTVKSTEKIVKANKAMLLSWQSVSRIMVMQVMHQAVSKIAGAMGNAVRTASTLEIKLAEIQTIAPTLRSDFEGVADSVRELSDQFGISADVVAEATYQTLSNQIADGADAFTFFASAADLSIGAVMSADDAVNVLSSTINSFGYHASQAATISGKLFKIIELGRVRGEEFANTFGRVSVLASQLGVSLDEVGASIATLTISGLKYDEAATLIINTFLKLIRPTDALKAAYEEMNVATAEAGIQAYGYQGFLDKLRTSAGKSASAIGELFGRVRAIRGVMGLTAEATERYQEALEAISEAGAKDIFEAKQLIFKTNAKQVQIELEQLKNVLLYDFGRNVLAVTDSIFDTFGGAVNILKAVAVAAGVAATGFAIWGAILFPIPAAIIAISLAAGHTALMLQKMFETPTDKIEQQIQKDKKAIIELQAAESDAVEERIRGVKKSLSILQKGVIARTLATRGMVAEAQAAEKFISGIINEQLSARESAYNKFVNAISDIIEGSAKNIANSQKKVFDLQLEMDRTAFDMATSGADDLGKSAAANQRAAQLIQRATKAYEEGQIERGEALFSEAKAATSLAISSAQTAKNSGAEYQARKILTKLYNEQLEIQENIQRVEQRKVKEAIKAEGPEKARLERIAAIIAKLKEIELFGKDGKLQAATADEARAMAKPYTDALKAELEDAGKDIDVFKRLGLQEQFAEAVKPFEDVFLKTPVSLDFIYEQRIQAVFGDIQKFADDNPINIKLAAAYEVLDADITGVKGLQEAPEIFTEIGKELPKLIRDTLGVAGAQQSYDNAIKNSKDSLAAFNLEAKEAKELLEKRARPEFTAMGIIPISPEQIKHLSSEINALNYIQEKVIAAARDGQAAVEDQFDPALYTSAINRLSVYESKLREAGKEDLADPVRTLISQLKEASQQSISIEVNAQNIRDAEAAEKQLEQSAREVNEVLGPQASSAAAMGANSVVSAEASMQSALIQTIALVNQRNAALAGGGGVHASTGGLMYLADGGVARGTDTIPAMLSPGEFVVNAGSTRKFFSQLVAMNSSPRGYESGGVTTNVGDVRITVNEAVSAKATARETMSAFRREMRKNTSKL